MSIAELRIALTCLLSCAGVQVAYAQESSLIVARYDSRGNLVSAFGGGHVVLDPTGPNSGKAIGLFGLGDGKVVLGGEVGPEGLFSRTNNDGSTDTSFGWLGVSSIAHPTEGGHNKIAAIGYQSNQRLIVAGTSMTADSLAFPTIEGFTANGARDSTFFVPGMGGGQVTLTDMEIDTSDRVIIAGSGLGLGVVIARAQRDGMWDWNFGRLSAVTIDMGVGFESAEGLALDGDKIVAASWVERPVLYGGAMPATHIGVVRITSTGATDPSYGSPGNGGRVFIDFQGTANELPQDIACWPNTGCVVVGSTDFTSGAQFAIARLSTTGQVLWKRTTPFLGANQSHAVRVAITRVGQNPMILVSGWTEFNGRGRVALARYDLNGNLDPNFGFEGKQMTVVRDNWSFVASDMAVDPRTGNITVIGTGWR